MGEDARARRVLWGSEGSPNAGQQVRTPKWVWVVIAISLTISTAIGAAALYAKIQRPDGTITRTLRQTVDFIVALDREKVDQVLAALMEHGEELQNRTDTGNTFGEPCSSTTLALTGPWAPPGQPRYVRSFESGLGEEWERYGGPHERWMQVGEHESNPVLEVQTEFETSCFLNMCRTCLTEITASIGFTPSVIRLHEKLRRNRCERDFTMRHELGHAEITRKAQAMALEEATRNLAWTQVEYPPIKTRENASHTAGDDFTHKIGEDLNRALNKAVTYATRANRRLDHPVRYIRESEERNRRCGTRRGAG